MHDDDDYWYGSGGPRLMQGHAANTRGITALRLPRMVPVPCSGWETQTVAGSEYDDALSLSPIRPW